MSYPVFPVVPDPDGILEVLEWLTDVHEGWSGEEQRVKLRDQARRYAESAFSLHRYDKPLLDAALFGNVGHEDGGSPDWLKWTVPVWWDMGFLSADLPAESTEIPISTPYRDFHGGGLAVVIRRRAGREFSRYRALRNEDWEIITIYTVNEGSIVIVGDTESAWEEGDLILPARVGWLDRPLEVDDLTDTADGYRGAAAFEMALEV